MSTENELDLESARTFPSIEISGTAKNIRIYNELTGKIIELDGNVMVRFCRGHMPDVRERVRHTSMHIFGVSHKGPSSALFRA